MEQNTNNSDSKPEEKELSENQKKLKALREMKATIQECRERLLKLRQEQLDLLNAGLNLHNSLYINVDVNKYYYNIYLG